MNFKQFLAKNELIQTIKGLFTRPKEVLESMDNRFLNGFAYISSISGTVFFVILFFDKFLFQDGLIDNNWRLPERLQMHHNIRDNVYDDFYGIIFTTGLIPGILLATLFLYWSKYTFKRKVDLTFYLVAQLLLIMSPLILLNYIFEWDVDDVTAFLLLGYSIYFFIRLGQNHWSIAIAKSVLILVTGLLGVSVIEKPLEQLFVNVMERPNEVYHPEVTDRSIFQNQVTLETEVHDLYEVDAHEGIIFYHDRNQFFGALSANGQSLWEKRTSAEVSKIVLIKEHNVLCVVVDTVIQEQKRDVIRAYDYDGKALFSTTLEGDFFGSAYNLLGVTDDSFELFVPAEIGIRQNYVYQKGIFTKDNEGKWHGRVVPFFESFESVYSLTSLSETARIATTSQYNGWQFASFGITRFDSLMQPQWSHLIYDKTNPYDPRVPAFHVVNAEENEVIIHHSIANDTIVMSYLRSLDLTTGALKWQKEFFIPADFTEYFKMDYDDNYLYIVGESHVNIRKYFWQPYFHIGMVCKINRRTGELVGYRHFGNTQFEGHTRISDLKLTDTTIQLFGTLKGGDNLLGENPQAFMWEIAKKDI
jgi:hypothetical protein